MKCSIVATTALACALVASVASADPFVITSGTIFVASPNGQNPPFGFQLLGAGLSLNGETTTLGVGGFSSGQAVDLSTTVTPSFVNHPIAQTVNGTTADAWLGGSLNLSATPFTAASNGGTFVDFTTPFTMTGTISGFANASRTGPPLFTVNLTGSGMATLNARDVGGAFVVPDGTSFNFAAASPTPEPATLLLLGLGAACVAGARRRRR